MESAKKLLQFNFNADAFARRAPHPMKVPQEIHGLIKNIIDRHYDKGISSDQNRHRQVYLDFINTRPRELPEKFDTFSRVRKLARVLTYSEDNDPRIVDTSQLCYALQLIENYFSTGALRGVCSALRQASDAQYTQMLEAFVKKYQTNPKLLPSYVRLSDILLNLKLPKHINGYRYYGAVAERHISIIKPRDKSTVADIVKFVEERHKDDQTNKDILSELIEQLGNDAFEHLRQPVQSYALQKWQTPWDTTKWKGISHKALRIFEKWIIKKDFQFFFDGIQKKSRKVFWSSYLEYISFSQPIVNIIDAENLFRNNQRNRQYYRDRRFATLKTRTKNQHAFIIGMGDHIFVEFSTKPTSMFCVYDKVRCPFKLNSSEYHINELRNLEWDKYHRSNLTNHSWQDKLASWIAIELGIKPLRNYRLDGKPNSYTISARVKSR